MTNLWKLLIDDHKELKRLFKQLEMTSVRSKKTRDKLFQQLRLLLDSHSKAEETVLYDRLRNEGDELNEKALEGFEEHHIAKIVLKELNLLPSDHERWGAKLKALKEAVEHHIQEEERTLIKLAKREFDQEQVQAMAEEFQALKRAHQMGLGLPFRIAAKAAHRVAEG